MAAGATYEPIATTTVSGGSTSEVQFASISGSYTDLIIVGNLGAATNSYTSARFNSDTGSNYSFTELYGNGSSAASDRASNKSIADFAFNVQNQSGVNGNFIAQIMNYSNSTTYKTVLCRNNLADFGTGATVVLWRSTAAITNIKLYTSTANGANQYNFASGSTFTLYGIAAA
jgi:hypothetical protein